MKTALVCISKNEDHYIDEWIKYHSKLGFDEIFVYQNNWRYTGDKSQYQNVHWVEFDGEVQQLPAYHNFINTYAKDFDWAAFFDGDEFLTLKCHNNLKDWLTNFNKFYAVGVNWRLFGNNGLTEVVDNNYSLIDRFTSADRNLNKHIKSILNLAKCKAENILAQIRFAEPHSFIQTWMGNFTVATNGVNFIHGPFNENKNNYTAQLNHYYCKTEKEFINIKCQRGFADCPRPTINFSECYRAHNKNDITDLQAYNFYHEKPTLNSRNDNNAICLIADGNNIQHFKFLVKQLKATTNVPIFVLTNNVSKIPSDGVTLIDISELENKYCKNRQHINHLLPNITLAKLYIPIIEQLKNFNKILYLDTDLQLGNNWQQIFQEQSPCWVKIVKEQPNLELYWSNEVFKKSNLKCQNYSNTGVMLFFINNINVDEYTNKLQEMIDADFKYQFHLRDQDLINLFFNKDHTLPHKFNTYVHEQTPETVIIHYTAHPNAKNLLNSLIQKEGVN